MGVGCGPNCTTFTLNVPLSSLSDEELESIRKSIIELLQDQEAGRVTVSFREGPTKADASTENPVNDEALAAKVTKAGAIQTLGNSNFIIAKINGTSMEYNNKLIIVKTDNTIAYIDGVGDEEVVVRSDWESKGIIQNQIKHVALGKDVKVLGSTDSTDGGFGDPDVNVFKDCGNLETVTLSPETIQIAGFIFNNCSSLKSFFITKKVDVMISPGDGGGSPALFFQGCSLESFYVDEQNQTWYSVDGVLFLGPLLRIFPNSDPRTSYTVPEDVTVISGYAFLECSALASITLPMTVTRIVDGAFMNCTSLVSITLPKKIQFVAPSILENCVNLKTVTFEDGRDEDLLIQYSMFKGCKELAAIDLPEKVLFDIVGFLPDEKSTSVFEGCTSLAKVTVRDPRVEEYLDRAFKDVPAVQDGSLDFNVANDLEQIQFGADNEAFSNKSTELDPPNKLYFGDDDSGGVGLKKVLLTPPS